MSFVASGGVSKWSQITIDANKDMLGFGMSNLKQVAAAMVAGDIVAKGLGGVLVRIAPGLANTFLQTAGPGALPYWGPGGLYLNRYIPVYLSLVDGQVIFTPNASKAVAAPLTSPYGYIGKFLAGVNPSWFKNLEADFEAPDAQVAPFAPDATDDEPVPPTTSYDTELPVASAQAANTLGTVFVDESAAAQSEFTEYGNYKYGTVQTQDQALTATADGQDYVTTTRWQAQTFQPSVEGWVTQIKCQLYKAGTPGNVLVSIRKVDPATGRPTGADLATATTFAGSGLSTTPGTMFTIAMNPVYVVPTQQYAIVARGDSADVSEIFWRFDASSPGYSRGKACLSTDTGGTWSDVAGTVFLFTQYYNATTSQKSVSGVNWEAQTFTNPTAHSIRYVDLYFYGGTTQVVTVSIRAVDGANHPTGADLCSGTVQFPTTGVNNINPVDSPGTWVRVWMATPVNLSGATRYAIVISKPSGAAAEFNWRCETASPTLANGNREFSSNSGASWTADATADFIFSESGHPVADMTLFPAVIGLNDAYYFGNSVKFPVLKVDMNPAGAGTYTAVWEYSTGGGTWAAIVGGVDNTNIFKASWTQTLTHTPQADWVTDTVNGIANMYWLRLRCTNVGAGYTQPKGCFAKAVVTV